MRGVILVAAMVLVSCAVGASAKQPPQKAAPKPDYAKAHGMAARCMIYSSIYRDEPRARSAFDAWKRLGELQGLSNRELNGELDVLTKWETQRLRDDPVYRSQTQVDCRALGWAQ